MMTRIFTFLLVVLVFACSETVKTTETTTLEAAFVPEVAFTTVQNRLFETKIDAIGTVLLDQYVIATEGGNSTIRNIAVKNFQRVKKGDLLISLKNSDVRVEFSKVLEDYRKQKALYEIDRKGRSGAQDTVAMKSFYGLTYLEEVLEQYRNRLKMEDRYAPFDGVVVFPKTFLVGETLPGGVEMMTLTQEGAGKFEIELPLLYASQLTAGIPVRIQGLEQLIRVEPNAVVTGNNNSILISLKLPGKHVFRHKERLACEIVTQSLGTVPVIPRTALLRRNAQYLFFVLREEDSLALWIPVQSPVMNDEWVHTAELKDYLEGKIAFGNHSNLTHFQKIMPSGLDAAE